MDPKPDNPFNSERNIGSEVLARLKDGEPRAFDLVYEAYRARLFGFLLRLSQRRDVAEDLLQETWLRLATRAGTLRDDTRLAAWLFTVARNLYLTWRRNRLLDEARTGELFLASLHGFQRPSPLVVACANELESKIEDALSAVPLPYREALLLMVEGLTASEAAAVCEVTPVAFRKRLSRARMLFEKRFAMLTVPRIGQVRRETA